MLCKYVLFAPPLCLLKLSAASNRRVFEDYSSVGWESGDHTLYQLCDSVWYCLIFLWNPDLPRAEESSVMFTLLALRVIESHPVSCLEYWYWFTCTFLVKRLILLLSSSTFTKCHDDIKDRASTARFVTLTAKGPSLWDACCYRDRARLPWKMSGRGKPLETCMLCDWVMPSEIQNTHFRVYQCLARGLLHAVSRQEL